MTETSNRRRRQNEYNGVGDWLQEAKLKRGGRDAEVEMGLGTSRAVVIITGKEKVEATGTSTVRHMVAGVEDDDLVGRNGAEAHAVFVVERTRVAARGGGVVIQPGNLLVSRVEKMANEVVGAISV